MILAVLEIVKWRLSRLSRCCGDAGRGWLAGTGCLANATKTGAKHFGISGLLASLTGFEPVLPP
jgi:hypothetical protein